MRELWSCGWADWPPGRPKDQVNECCSWLLECMQLGAVHWFFRSVLCPALCGRCESGWPSNCHLWCSPTRGDFWSRMLNCFGCSLLCCWPSLLPLSSFRSSSFPPSQILTKDSVTARVDAVVYFRIKNPIHSVVKVENAYNSTYRVAQTSLRDVLGTKNLAELLSDREHISEQMGVGLVTVSSMYLLMLSSSVYYIAEEQKVGEGLRTRLSLVDVLYFVML